MMNSDNDAVQPPTYKIRTSELTTEGYNFVKTHFSSIMKLAALPLIASVGVVILSIIWPQGSLTAWLSAFVEYGAMIMFVVAIHRFYLLDDKPDLRLGKREFRFWAYTIGLALLAFIPFFTISLLGTLLGATTGYLSISHWGIFALIGFGGVFLFYAALRISLIFPSVAVDYPGGFISHLKLSWSTMKGNVWALFCAMFLMGLLIFIVLVIPTLLISALQSVGLTPESASVVRALFVICANFLNGLFAVIFASICFKKMVLVNSYQSGI